MAADDTVSRTPGVGTSSEKPRENGGRQKAVHKRLIL
jgi:hypothetical protein